MARRRVLESGVIVAVVAAFACAQIGQSDEPEVYPHVWGQARTALEAIDRAQQCTHSDWGRVARDLDALTPYLPQGFAAALARDGYRWEIDPTGSGHGYVIRLWHRYGDDGATVGRDPDGRWLGQGFDEPIVRGCERLKRRLRG